MQNPKLNTLVRIRYFLTIAQQTLGLVLLALEIYERIQFLF